MFQIEPRSLFPIAWIVLLCALLAMPVLSHDTWLLPGRSAVQPGASVSLDLTSGMAFPASESAIKPDRIAQASCRLAGKTFSLTDRKATSKALRLTARLTEPGLATLWVELAPKSIDMKPEQVEHYLDEIGATEEVRRAWAESPKPRRWRESYVKNNKTFVQVGQTPDVRSWAEPVGLALEIVPQSDPSTLRPGETLSVLVLRNGKPLPSFSLGIVREGQAKGTLTVTDSAGRATFKLDRAGRWLIRGTNLRPPTRPDAAWESDFTTLTIEVR